MSAQDNLSPTQFNHYSPGTEASRSEYMGSVHPNDEMFEPSEVRYLTAT